MVLLLTIMKNKYIFLFGIVLFLNSSVLHSQFAFTIVPCADSTAVVDLIDSCFLSQLSSDRFKNIEFHGNPSSVGYFYNGFLFGFSIPRGIIMSTGFADDIDRPNTCLSQNTSGNNGGGSDSDLQIISNSQINDACVIEFDFMPIGDTLSFKFVFGSEEYHEYVSWGINDAIGLFLSGTDIVGPFSNDAINIATVPGSGFPITISTINCGRQQFPCTPPPGSNSNCDLLIDNSNMSNSGFNSTVLDAYTIPIKADYNTQYNLWYHIKLAIGDAADAICDSGLLLEAGSFFTGVYTAVEYDSMDDKNNFEALLFPNPTKKSVNIVVNSIKKFKFEVLIFDKFGRQQIRKKFNHNSGQDKYKIDIPNLSPGIYFVKVLTSSGMTKLLKLEVVN